VANVEIAEKTRLTGGTVEFFRRLGRFPIYQTILLMPIVIFGIFGPFIWPHDPIAMNLSMALKPPAWINGGSWANLLGTDKFGRDLFSLIIQGARASLIVSVFGVFFSGLIGVALGMIAGYFRGKTDTIIMRLVDIWMSIPPILFVILLSGILGGGLTTIIISIAIVFWTGYARIVRGETLSIMEREYIALAKVTGCSHVRILIKHVFPNLINTIMVMATLQIGAAIMIESAITFLGIGIQPPDTAWGLLISDGRSYMSTAWWIPTFPGLAIMLTILGANSLGDWLRDKFDPRMRQL
jgi:peptide/nickel transport system permease protein